MWTVFKNPCNCSHLPMDARLKWKKNSPYLNVSGQGLVKVSLEKLNSSFTKLMVNTTKIQKKRKLICFVSELKLSDNTKFITLITIRINDRDIQKLITGVKDARDVLVYHKYSLQELLFHMYVPSFYTPLKEQKFKKINCRFRQLQVKAHQASPIVTNLL